MELTDTTPPPDAPGSPDVQEGRVVLKPRKAQPFLARHPWVFASAIERIDGEPRDGGVVDLVSDRGRFLARGILNRASLLRVRLYAWDENQSLDREFWRRRIEAAVAWRRQLGLVTPHTGARLVFSEADGLSGLVVDWFAGHLAAQLNARAMSVRWPMLASLLTEILRPESITYRVDATIAAEEGIEPHVGFVPGGAPPESVVIEEHGLRYRVDLRGGQKTGFYLDQRDNRLAAAKYLRERRVLDLFCYTGGFSLTAAKLGGAREVVGVDSSKKAIAVAQSNAALNSLGQVRFEVGEAFEVLGRLHAQGERLEAIVLDPPKFTRTRRGAAAALQAYHRLNRQAVELLAPGGILITCSCSGGVLREDFREMLAGVAQKSTREMQILEQRGAAPDHPVGTACPESEYLKCFICRVT